ncbi:MAG: hypothetical protein K2K93_06280, partial [Muribaculaceae bacterium]|nr:hypothetical protein [Muribaculaceae bacterium]
PAPTDREEANSIDKEEEVATEQVVITPDTTPENNDSIQLKAPIRFEEDTVEIDATLIEPATGEDNAVTSENVIDFSSVADKVSDPTIAYDTADMSSSETSEFDIPEKIMPEGTQEADYIAEKEDDAEELDESIYTEEASLTAEIEEESESFEESAGGADTVLEEPESTMPITDDEESPEYSGNTDAPAEDAPDSLIEGSGFEADDQSESTDNTQQFGLIMQTADDNDEEDGLDEVHDVEELQPESYEDDEIEPEVQGTRRRQWLKGFMVGIAAAVGAILITFLVWYFYTSPSFKEKEPPREAPNLFTKNNEPVSSEVISTPETEPETDSESVATTDEEISVPDAGKTDTEVAKAVATVASDAVVYDKISTTRYLITMAKEHYGNMNLWPYIYEENKHKLGDPDRIRPGTSVVIPPLSKYGIDPKNPKDIEKAKRLGKEIYARFGK